MALVRKFHRVAGLVIAVYDMDAGDRILNEFKGGTEQSRYAFHAMQVRRDAQVYRPDGLKGLLYKEGETNADRAQLPMLGVYPLVALANATRHICISNAKRGGRFEFADIRLDPGNGFTLPKGAVFALGNGTVEHKKRGPKEQVSDMHVFHAQSGIVDFTAITRCLGIMAWIPA